MPTFPRYDSQARFEVGTRSLTSFPGLPSTGRGEALGAFQGLLSVTQEIAGQWQAAERSMQETRAKAVAAEKIAQIESEAELDENINGEEERSKQLYKGKLESLKGIPEGKFKEALSLEIDHHFNLADIRIKTLYNHKKVFADHINTSNLLDKYAKIGTPEAYQEAFNLVEKKVAAGFYTAAQGAALYNGTREAGLENDILNDPALDDKDSRVLADLKDKTKYEFLSTESRIQFISEAQRKIRQNKQLQDEAVIDNRLNLLNDFANGRIDLLTTPDLVKRLSIQDPELGEAIIKGSDNLFMPKPDEEAFAQATKEVFQAATKEEVSKYLVNVLNSNANKELGRERLAILINAATERAKNLRATSGGQPVTPNPKQVETDSLVKSLLFNMNPLLSVSNMVVNFFNGIKSGQSPKAAHDQALRSEIQRTNNLSVKYKVGDIVTNPAGLSGEVVGFNEYGSPIIKRKK